MQGDSFSIHEMYNLLMPQYLRVAWKNLALHNKIHTRFKFILWQTVQNRLATAPRLLKFGVQVPKNCIFCGQALESFEHLFFKCAMTILYGKGWLGFRRAIQDWNCELQWLNTLAKSKIGLAEISSRFCYDSCTDMEREEHLQISAQTNEY